jgi:hypothetical protein
VRVPVTITERLQPGRDFLDEVAKWGKNAAIPFNVMELATLLQEYETAIIAAWAAGQAAQESALTELRDEKNAQIAKLTGEIGGLRKQLNKTTVK